VIDDRRRTGLKRFECSQLGGPIEHFQVDSYIKPPPDLLKDFSEVAWWPGRARHSSGQR